MIFLGCIRLSRCFNNNDAIDKHYSPNYSKYDKDLALLVLKFGWPSLLKILHRAKGFPGISTSYRLVKSKKLHLESHVSIPAQTIMRNVSEVYENPANEFYFN